MAIDFLKNVFGENALTFEQFEAALKSGGIKLGNLSDGAYVSKEKFDNANAELARIRAENENYKNDIAALRNSAADAETLKSQIADLEKKISERDEADKKALYERNMQERFNNLCGNLKFVNDITKNGIMSEFREAVEKPENAGKSDKDVLDALLYNREGILANANPAIDIPGIGDIGGDRAAAEAFKNMNLIQQMKFAQESPAEYEKIKNILNAKE